MNYIYILYIVFKNFLKDKLLEGLIADGYKILESEGNNFILCKITDSNYDIDNENYVSKLVMSNLKHKSKMIKKPISADISEKMNIWISKAKKDKNNQYSVVKNNYLHTLIRTYLTSLIIRNI